MIGEQPRAKADEQRCAEQQRHARLFGQGHWRIIGIAFPVVAIAGVVASAPLAEKCFVNFRQRVAERRQHAHACGDDNPRRQSRPRAEQQGIELVLDAPESLSALVDQGLLGQCVWNLTDNALKFADRGGHVRVVVSERPDEIVLEVEDDGPGLGSFDASSPFERFFRADEARTRGPDAAGTGLGLAIVKAVAEAHGGRATAENRSTEGARFTVRFPRVTHYDEGVES